MNSLTGIKLKKLSLAGVIVSLGIVFGDIGTSPLYVMKAIVHDGTPINELLIIGSLSCIIWTLTLQTTIKYVLITMRADNKGEGGIFSLFALLRRRRAWLYIFAIIGGSTLLADGIITPSITVMSSIEGLALDHPTLPVLPVVLVIITCLFFIQQFGTSFIGKSFGPIMFFWFLMLGVLGLNSFIGNPVVLKAFNPYYVYLFLSQYPSGFLLLGAVFLCTTGAEALYADIGHCGVKNIRISWIFVKITLILNYLGQSAWVLKNIDTMRPGVNPFYSIIPHWFFPIGSTMAAMAAIIASQALISGSYTLISEAVSLNFWPKNRIKYPSSSKGQMYIPFINWLLFISCVAVILLFQNSSNMEAAYGLSITITMLMTTILVAYFLRSKRVPKYIIYMFAATYFLIEGSFLVANMHKFSHGGWFTILVGTILSLLMIAMYQGRKVRNRFISFYKVEPYLPIISAMSDDESIPKFACNLVYTTHANNDYDLEAKTIDSIIHRNPKRADKYWFLHVDIVDNPYMLEYKVTELVPGKIIRIDFFLGFKVQPRINEYFVQVLKHLSDEGKIDLLSSHPSLRKHNILSEFRFVQIDRSVIKQTELGFFDGLELNIYYRLKNWGLSDISAYGLESSQVVVEHIPLTLPTKRTKPPMIRKRD
jgi:KUP system potassium uptake protein